MAKFHRNLPSDYDSVFSTFDVVFMFIYSLS